MLLYISQAQKSKSVLTGLKSRCGHCCVLCGSSGGESVLYIVPLLEASYTVAHGCVTPMSALVIMSALTDSDPLFSPFSYNYPLSLIITPMIPLSSSR